MYDLPLTAIVTLTLKLHHSQIHHNQADIEFHDSAKSVTP